MRWLVLLRVAAAVDLLAVLSDHGSGSSELNKMLGKLDPCIVAAGELFDPGERLLGVARNGTSGCNTALRGRRRGFYANVRSRVAQVRRPDARAARAPVRGAAQVRVVRRHDAQEARRRARRHRGAPPRAPRRRQDARRRLRLRASRAARRLRRGRARRRGLRRALPLRPQDLPRLHELQRDARASARARRRRTVDGNTSPQVFDYLRQSSVAVVQLERVDEAARRYSNFRRFEFPKCVASLGFPPEAVQIVADAQPRTLAGYRAALRGSPYYAECPCAKCDAAPARHGFHDWLDRVARPRLPRVPWLALTFEELFGGNATDATRAADALAGFVAGLEPP